MRDSFIQYCSGLHVNNILFFRVIHSLENSSSTYQTCKGLHSPHLDLLVFFYYTNTMESASQPQRIMNSVGSDGGDNGGGFLQLPTELLEEIYVLSENLCFPLVYRQFFQCLDNDYILLRFCTRVFFLGNPNNLHSGVVCPSLQRLATAILAQSWFTRRFAKEMEKAVLEMQNEAIFYSEKLDGPGGKDIYTERHCPYTGGCVPMLGRNRFTAANQVYLPARLLRAPWSNDIRRLLELLKDWGVRLSDADVDLCNEALKSAITSNDDARFRILMLFRGEIDHELFRMVVTSGSNCSLVRIILAHANHHIVSNSTMSGKERSALMEWVSRDWAKAVVQRDQELGKLKPDDSTVTTGCTKGLKGDNPKGGASTPVGRSREGDGLFRAQLKRVFRQQRVVYIPVDP